MPSSVTLPFVQCHHVRGFALSGVFWNFENRSSCAHTSTAEHSGIANITRARLINCSDANMTEFFGVSKDIALIQIPGFLRILLRSCRLVFLVLGESGTLARYFAIVSRSASCGI